MADNPEIPPPKPKPEPVGNVGNSGRPSLSAGERSTPKGSPEAGAGVAGGTKGGPRDAVKSNVTGKPADVSKVGDSAKPRTSDRGPSAQAGRPTIDGVPKVGARGETGYATHPGDPAWGGKTPGPETRHLAPGALESKGAAKDQKFVAAYANEKASHQRTVQGSLGEAAAYREALEKRGEIGLERPDKTAAPGRGDFLTAKRGADGKIDIIVTDVKTRTTDGSAFPTARDSNQVPDSWKAKVNDAVKEGRLDLGDKKLEQAIREAAADGRVTVRQANVDNTTAGQGKIEWVTKGTDTKPTGGRDVGGSGGEGKSGQSKPDNVEKPSASGEKSSSGAGEKSGRTDKAGTADKTGSTDKAGPTDKAVPGKPEAPTKGRPEGAGGSVEPPAKPKAPTEPVSGRTIEKLEKGAAAALRTGEKVAHGAGRALDFAGKAFGVVGKILDAKQAWDESREIIARERPEALKEGEKVPLTMLETPYKPMSPVPSGYTVEKADGKILYRDAEGKAVTRETAIRNSTGYREDRDRIRDHGA